jgi:prevent-host-death family protein
MITVKENTTLIGISELRNEPERIFKEMRKRPIVIGKHRKPVAVLIPMEEYEEMGRLLEMVEDYVLGMLAQERDKKHKNPKWVSIEEALKRVGLKH